MSMRRPSRDKARTELEKALADCGLEGYEYVDVMAEKTARELRGWGSPTILINGKDVAGHQGGDEVGCRVYAGELGVPDARTIADFLQRSTQGE